MNPLYLLFFLLPVAAFSGWYLARRSSARVSGERVSALSSSYFRGLNYLLNEQQDKAIEVFVKLAEVNRDTVETHLALGTLIRRRGEVDRAIRVHQNLIARPNLTDEMKTIALLELGEDYMRAGLLDRAETLFSDLVAMKAHAPSALKHLIAIYQHERDWDKAIDHARRLEQMTGDSQGPIIAQFYCELAEQARQQRNFPAALEYLQQASEGEPSSVRASMLQGQLLADEGRYAEAVDAFEQVADRDVDFVPEILPPLLDCYAKSQQMQRAEKFLMHLLERYQGISPVIALTKLYYSTLGESASIDFLTRQLRQRPSVRGLMSLINATLYKSSGEARENLLILQDLTRKLVEGQAMYRCTRCGFGAKAHHWQCPSCKSWGAVRPIHGVANE